MSFRKLELRNRRYFGTDCYTNALANLGIKQSRVVNKGLESLSRTRSKPET